MVFGTYTGSTNNDKAVLKPLFPLKIVKNAVICVEKP
jgi:hypothetical protein